jgi:hypothetical protein
MVDIGITFGGDDFPDHPLMVYAQRDRALAKTYRGGAYSMQPIAEHFCVSRMRVSRAVNKNEEQTSVVPDVNCET